MKNKEKMAVFMDHSKARFIACTDGVAHFSDLIESDRVFHIRTRGEGSQQTRFGSDPYQGSNDEYSKNMQVREMKRSYFQQVKDKLTPYQEILIFGGGVAKREMLHFLLEHNGFQQKKIYVENSDYLTDNQLLETVRNYFTGR